MKEQKRELAAWKRIRSLSWTVMIGYADPKKVPATQAQWWPMEGDVTPKPFKITKKYTNKIAAAIRAELERGNNTKALIDF